MGQRYEAGGRGEKRKGIGTPKQRKLRKWPQNTKDAKLNMYPAALLISSTPETANHLPDEPLSRVYHICQAVSTPNRPAEKRPASYPPETIPHAKQSLLANSRRDLFATNGDTESQRSRVVDTSIRATLASN